jgi:23S rRNA (adenine1618-N6)-methyltransferase
MNNKTNPKKGILHSANRHNGRYDFNALTQVCPELSAFVINNPANESTIDFSNSEAIRVLNKALLMFFYDVQFWQIPSNYLCPPIPGRADYIHYLADILAEDNDGIIPRGKQIKVLDIGMGANCIYPIIGSRSYDWSFVGSDIDPVSVKTANLIVKSNTNLSPFIKIRLQKKSASIFNHIIKNEDKFTLTMCNPPFHASMEKAHQGNARKTNNLNKGKAAEKVTLNFAGQENELCCAGGEIAFLKQMANESVQFSGQVKWFSSLISKSENVAPMKKLLTQLGARQIKVVKMSQGQKISRFIAWNF